MSVQVTASTRDFAYHDEFSTNIYASRYGKNPYMRYGVSLKGNPDDAITLIGRWVSERSAHASVVGNIDVRIEEEWKKALTEPTHISKSFSNDGVDECLTWELPKWDATISLDTTNRKKTGKCDFDVTILAGRCDSAIRGSFEELFRGLLEQFGANRSHQLNIICHSDGSFYLKDFTLPEQDEFSLDDFLMNYNEDFIPVRDHIISSLNGGTKGIVLLHGKPGTGKTSFIRRLITQVHKQIIYLPPDMAEMISSPQFVTFLIEHPRSVLLIEDAENVLMSREAGDNQSVSNLLNVSDGLLGDILETQLVCSFNIELAKIDAALRRKGRLIAEYEFAPLSVERSRALVQKLHGTIAAASVTSPMVLADIYGMATKTFSIVQEKRGIGF